MNTRKPALIVTCTLVSGATLGAQISFTDTIVKQLPGSYNYGHRIATGDVNGDGALDIAVVDPGWETKGRGWVLLGPDFQSEIEVELLNPSPLDFLGGLSGAWKLRDVTGDGLDDLLIGGSYSAAGTALQAVGRALIAFAPDFQTAIELQHPDPTQAMTFGRAMEAYDFTGDGVVDVAVGSPDASGPLGEPGGGRIDIYSGAALQHGPVLTWIPPAPIFLESWGTVIEVADHDGNGEMDLLTSDRFNGPGFSWMIGIDPESLFSWEIDPGPLGFPYMQTVLSDLDLDGSLDVVASETLLEDVGISYGPDHLNEIFLKEPPGDVTTAFGSGLDAGDLNRDGIPDIVIGMPELDIDDMFSRGRVTLYYGPDYTTTQSFEGDHQYAFFGRGVHLVDLDDDGFEEVLIGASEYGGNLHLLDHHTLRILGQDQVSVTTGGKIRFSIGVGALSGASAYVLLIGASGSEPGVDLPYAGGFVHVPLNPDGITTAGLAQLGSPLFEKFLGTTSPEGDATPTLHLSAGLIDPAFAGTTISAAAVIVGPDGVNYATEAVEFSLAP